MTNRSCTSLNRNESPWFGNRTNAAYIWGVNEWSQDGRANRLAVAIGFALAITWVVCLSRRWPINVETWKRAVPFTCWRPLQLSGDEPMAVCPQLINGCIIWQQNAGPPGISKRSRERHVWITSKKRAHTGYVVMLTPFVPFAALTNWLLAIYCQWM